MKSKHISILAILAAITLIGSVTTGVQQVSAPRDCGSCVQFKKLTHEFEKDAINAATNGDPDTIPSLLEQYNEDVRALDFTR